MQQGVLNRAVGKQSAKSMVTLSRWNRDSK
jgi:hypothetical protein